jgi:hypothetical protein
MLTSIPTEKVSTIIQTILNNQNRMKQSKKQKTTHIVLSQNYFRCNNDYYKHEEILAKEALSSAILTEINLQFLEYNNIYNTHIKLKIIGYFIYAEDMLLIYSEKLTDINLMLQEFNNIKPNLQFMIEEKQ